MKLTVLLIFVALVLCAVSASMRMAKTDREILVQATQRGLEKLYDASVADAKTNGAIVTNVSPNELCETLRRDKEQLLPSFIEPAEILVPTRNIKLGSADLLYVVRGGDRLFYGISASRKFSQVGPGKLAAWSHRSFQEFPTNTVSERGKP